MKFLFFLLNIFYFSSLWANGFAPQCRPSFCYTNVKDLAGYTKLAAYVNQNHNEKRVVKLVYVREPLTQKGSVYFFNTEQFEYHYDFVTDRRNGLGLNITIENFNRNYTGTGQNRNFVMASLIYDPEFSGSQLLLELWTGDTLARTYIKELVDQLKLVLQVPFIFHPLSQEQEQVVSQQTEIPYILTTQLYPNKNFWILNPGKAIGRVVFIKSEEDLEKKCLDYKSIVVFEKVPNDLGLVGGVITAQYQTPMSHVNVKSINRGTLNLAYLDVYRFFKEKGIQEGDTIELSAEISSQSPQIKRIDPNVADRQIENFWKLRRPQGLNPQDLITKAYRGEEKGFTYFNQLIPHDPSKKLHTQSIHRFGAKSTNLAVLYQHRDLYPSVKTPYGFAIPFYYFDQFMSHEQWGLDPEGTLEPDPKMKGQLTSPGALIERILKSRGFFDSPKSICEAKPTLKDIREIILRAQVSEELLLQFKKSLWEDESSLLKRERTPIAKIRLRSSTNSEDLEGFTGAGLYNSDGLSLYKKHKSSRLGFDKTQPKSWLKIQEKLKEKIPYLYSSVWNDRAFEEREWFGFKGKDHLSVKVGIAVHRAFPLVDFDGQVGELANGVGISKNIYDFDQEDQVYINGQHFDLAVTNPPTEDQLVLYNISPDDPYSTEENVVTTFDALGNEDNWKKWSFARLSHSSVLDGIDVLKSDGQQIFEVQELAFALKKMHRLFARIYQKSPQKFTLDTEWKIYGPNREIWFKQSRPLVRAQKKNFANDVGRIGPPNQYVKPPRRENTRLGPKEL